MTNIYIGNLSPRTTQEEIRKLFKPYGEVESVDLIADRYSGKSRGFGFVKMNYPGAREAIAALNRKEVDGRNIKVNKRNSPCLRSVSTNTEYQTFSPKAEFIQTCGHCGCIFRVELERPRLNNDLQEYCCPECHHHTCRAKTPMPPRVTLISKRTDGRKNEYLRIDNNSVQEERVG